MTILCRKLATDLGMLFLAERGTALLRVAFASGPIEDFRQRVGARDAEPGEAVRLVADTGSAAGDQLREYAAGQRRTFELELRPRGTPFQQQVWRALQAIPCGEVRSYGQLARAIGRPDAVRAVGAANGQNPIAIVVPCHRVIGSDGALTGYAFGIACKRRLLEHEGALAAGLAQPSGSAAASPGRYSV